MDFRREVNGVIEFVKGYRKTSFANLNVGDVFVAYSNEFFVKTGDRTTVLVDTPVLPELIDGTELFIDPSKEVIKVPKSIKERYVYE